MVSDPNDFEVKAGIDYIVWRVLRRYRSRRVWWRVPSPIVVPANGSVSVDIGHDVRSKMMVEEIRRPPP